ncbi:MAG TPA: chromate transporter [Anaerolineaceae bacterium]|nr:chromate transporter [Anaerolineaceae bacterium]
MIYLQLFFSFLIVGLFSIGGGYAAMPIIQSEIVAKHGWLSLEEFSHLVTIAEMTPGPIVVNGATFVGNRIAGIPGAIIATLGSIFPALIIVSLLAYLYYRYKTLDLMNSILSSLRPVVIALIASAGLSILLHLLYEQNTQSFENLNWLGLLLFGGAFFAMRKLKWNPVLVMFLCGGLYLGIQVLITGA